MSARAEGGARPGAPPLARLCPTAPQGKNLISQLLTMDPTKRCTASDAMLHQWIRGGAQENGEVMLRECLSSLVGLQKGVKHPPPWLQKATEPQEHHVLDAHVVATTVSAEEDWIDKPCIPKSASSDSTRGSQSGIPQSASLSSRSKSLNSTTRAMTFTSPRKEVWCGGGRNSSSIIQRTGRGRGRQRGMRSRGQEHEVGFGQRSCPSVTGGWKSGWKATSGGVPTVGGPLRVDRGGWHGTNSPPKGGGMGSVGGFGRGRQAGYLACRGPGAQGNDEGIPNPHATSTCSGNRKCRAADRTREDGRRQPQNEGTESR